MVGGQRVAFEETLASLRQGLATYMLISRFGQWFNVRGIGTQVQDNGAVISCHDRGRVALQRAQRAAAPARPRRQAVAARGGTGRRVDRAGAPSTRSRRDRWAAARLPRG